MGKLENLLSFNDFEKNWNPRKQKTTKRTEVGIDILNENYKKWTSDSKDKDALKKQLLNAILRYINTNQVKPITVSGDKITFYYSGDKLKKEKFRLDRDDANIVLWKRKAEETYEPYKEKGSDGVVREKKKKVKHSEMVEVKYPIEKRQAEMLYKALSDRAKELKAQD